MLTALIVAGMLLAVMFTTGRTVGAEQRVLATLDSAQTRTILIRADDGAGVRTDVLKRIAALQQVEWAGAFGRATDGVNADLPSGERVPVRAVYTEDLGALGIPTARSTSGTPDVWLSADAARELGLSAYAGAVQVGKATWGVGGELDAPTYLDIFEPLALAPSEDGNADISVLLIVATESRYVSAVAATVSDLLAPEDPGKVSLETSSGLTQLKEVIQGQLGTFSRGLVLALLAVTAVLIGSVVYGLVTLRRRDFGRRRALGASRAVVVWLILGQTFALSLLGAAIGTALAWILLTVLRDPLPDWSFTVAVSVLLVLAATLSSLLPAVVASRRDPVRELRVP
ncbi:FtsX-like permease family protein [Microbacterium sp. PRF11]|uniref:ABC transporter permease n=1 Tax=Microbacterium sp. PRF11 TaxID=2962593 RepID=UPI002882083A|nr:FtsX-like permease family protein [Microbacterium sp. PRF11]MDT0116603.1 FtsX-like permease family protein [Microbacterium sp. PRF11]